MTQRVHSSQLFIWQSRYNEIFSELIFKRSRDWCYSACHSNFSSNALRTLAYPHNNQHQVTQVVKPSGGMKSQVKVQLNKNSLIVEYSLKASAHQAQPMLRYIYAFYTCLFAVSHCTPTHQRANRLFAALTLCTSVISSLSAWRPTTLSPKKHSRQFNKPPQHLPSVSLT